MPWLAHIAAGLALAVAGWLVPRHIARARPGPPVALLVDAAPLAVGAGLLMLATGRPVFGGVVILALGIGFALADQTMRDTLREPVVFSEMSEVPQVFTHPQLYLPFAGPALVIGLTAAAILLGLGLLILEPTAWPPHPLFTSVVLLFLVFAGWRVGYEPWRGGAAALLRRLGPTGEPFSDATRLGPFAMLLAHGMIARAERPARRAAVPAPAMRAPTVQRHSEPGRPLVMVQCESFFDARRLSPLVPAEALAAFEQACRTGAQFGRIEVPGWGANTMRTEFAVLTGIHEEALGYDRFNPYHAFARVPIASQVWRLRQAGYRTICLHPFDGRFFRRDLTMPAMGFDQFLDAAALGASRRPPYCSDPELARHILRVLDENGPRTFIFAISMGNHGPWLGPEASVVSPFSRALSDMPVRHRGELLRYVDGVGRSDEMLGLLLAGLAERSDGRSAEGAMLGFFGDHQPSLPHAFERFGFEETGSDYVVWPGEGAPVRRIDLPAHRLGALIVDRLLGEVDVPRTTSKSIRERPRTAEIRRRNLV